MNISHKPPLLSDAEIERYARHIVIPGVGAHGQARLCASRVRAAGNATGLEYALSYLQVSGVQAVAGPPAADTELFVVAGTDALSRRQAAMLASSTVPVLWYVLEGCEILSGSGAEALGAALRRAPGSRSMAGSEVWADEPLHAIAACDLAASAIGLLLGWPAQSSSPEVTLA